MKKFAEGLEKIFEQVERAGIAGIIFNFNKNF